jgi:hypothetical protein
VELPAADRGPITAISALWSDVRRGGLPRPAVAAIQPADGREVGA